MYKNDQEWRVSLLEVEKKLGYTFKDRKLLEEALTHSSFKVNSTTSYQRLEFIGDAVLKICFAEFFFHKYPDAQEKDLSLLTECNSTNEKLARVSVSHHLYSFLRATGISFLHHDVEKFTLAAQQVEEIESTVYGGAVKAPKVLGDIVESIIGAAYVDCGSDLKVVWPVIKEFLHPIITRANRPSQPMTELNKIFQKQGKRVHIDVQSDQNIHYCNIYVDGEFFVVGSSDQSKDNAKLNAAKEALEKLNPSCVNRDLASFFKGYELSQIKDPLQNLNNLCAVMKWNKPRSSVKEEGPPHNKRFTCSVELITEKGQLSEQGDEKSKKREAEKSAASSMMLKLAELYISGELATA